MFALIRLGVRYLHGRDNSAMPGFIPNDVTWLRRYRVWKDTTPHKAFLTIM
jgi:hypothetical protein